MRTIEIYQDSFQRVYLRSGDKSERVNPEFVKICFGDVPPPGENAWYTVEDGGSPLERAASEAMALARMQQEGRATLGLRLLDALDRIKDITQLDLSRGHGIDKMIRHTGEEHGEFCNAVSVENGEKVRELKEDSKSEAVDYLACVLSLFYAVQGTDEFMAEYLDRKLTKWEANVRDELARLPVHS